MIDNFKLISQLLDFQEEGDFYMVRILKRKKDQPEEVKDKSQSSRTIKTYCLSSLSHFESRYEEIRSLCEIFRARAYIYISRRNHKDVSLEMLARLAKKIQVGQYNQISLFDSVVDHVPGREKRWIVDIDSIDEELDREIQEHINLVCRPHGAKILANVPTKNGHHLITPRFDLEEFRRKYPGIDVHKKSPTLLYLPSSLEEKEEKVDVIKIVRMSWPIDNLGGHSSTKKPHKIHKFLSTSDEWDDDTLFEDSEGAWYFIDRLLGKHIHLEGYEIFKLEE